MKAMAIFLMLIATTCLQCLENSSQSPKTKHKDESWADSQQLLPFIESQLASLRSGKIESVYKDNTSQEFRKTTSLDQFKEFVSKYPVLSKNKSFQFHSMYVEDDIATFQGALISTNGDILQTEFDLIHEGDAWKILGIQLFKPEMNLPRSED